MKLISYLKSLFSSSRTTDPVHVGFLYAENPILTEIYADICKDLKNKRRPI